jgi:hypothetical protein
MNAGVQGVALQVKSATVHINLMAAAYKEKANQ